MLTSLSFLPSLLLFPCLPSLLMFNTTRVSITVCGVIKVFHVKASPYYAVRQTYPPEWVQSQQHSNWLAVADESGCCAQCCCSYLQLAATRLPPRGDIICISSIQP